MTTLLKNSSSQDRVSNLLPGDAAPAAPVSLRSSRAAGAASFVSIRVSPAMAILLKALAAHDGLPGINALIADMAEERARAVGVPRLLRAVCDCDAGAANPVQQGREAVSHLVHTQEVGSSNLPPATSHNPESLKGPEGVPWGALRSPP